MNSEKSERTKSEEELQQTASQPWTEEETKKFIEAFAMYEGDWQQISNYVRTRSVIDVYKYWVTFFEQLNDSLKEDFFDTVLKCKKKACEESQSSVSQSFFSQRIVPLINKGYEGLFSLVDMQVTVGRSILANKKQK